MNIDDWIRRCRAACVNMDTAPYLDAKIPPLEDALPFSYGAARRDAELVRSFAHAAELHLAQSPGDISLRLAALYPLRQAALSNVFQERIHFGRHVPNEELQAYKHLVALCVPEKLGSLRELKFELHNMYLAGNWDKAGELFSRLALLGLLEPAQMHAMRGQFWFLSVFGRRIKNEMDKESDLDCDWVYTLPESASRGPDFELSTRPEILEEGSSQHWVLVAWCTNPRSPARYPALDLPQLAEDGLLIDPLYLEEPPQTAEWTKEKVREVRQRWQDLYRDFEPITFSAPGVLRERLIRAIDDLRQAEKLAKNLGARYHPLVGRAEFALGNFNEAGAAFERALEDRFAFVDSEGTPEDYQWETQFSAAWAHRLAGDCERAVEVMKRGGGSQTALPGAGWWIAKWYSESGKYDEAAQELKRESETFLSLPDSWLLSSVLALAAVAKDEEGRAERFVERLRRDSPDIIHLLESILAEQWPRFEKLQPASRHAWLHALCETYVEPAIPGGAVQNYRDAVHGYGWILESELRMRIFNPFRERVIKDPDLKARSIKEQEKWPKDSLLVFIHAKQDGLTLGQMIKVLKATQDPRNDTEKALLRWLNERFPALRASISFMTKLNLEWRLAKHENPLYQRRNVLDISSLCKKALDWL